MSLSRRVLSLIACTAVLLGTQLLAAEPSLAATATSAAGKGCAATTGGIPAGAMQARIGDVDGDGRADTEFMTNNFRYGIRTASGATHTVSAALAGPAWHLGWTARMQDGTVLTVIDDQRDAELFTFSGCAFHAVKNRQGSQYTFGLDGFSDYGTGVACSSTDRHLQGLQLRKHANGRYTIDRTRIVFSANHRTATNGNVHHGTTSYAANSSTVRRANQSTCGTTAKVHTTIE
jgi:hypothetical protein